MASSSAYFSPQSFLEIPVRDAVEEAPFYPSPVLEEEEADQRNQDEQREDGEGIGQIGGQGVQRVECRLLDPNAHVHLLDGRPVHGQADLQVVDSRVQKRERARQSRGQVNHLVPDQGEEVQNHQDDEPEEEKKGGRDGQDTAEAFVFQVIGQRREQVSD